MDESRTGITCLYYIFKLYQTNIKFIDITDNEYPQFNQDSFGIMNRMKFPTEAKNQEIVSRVLQELSKDEMKSFLQRFSGFYTRYFKSKSGRESSIWLFDQVSELASLRKDVKLTVEQFKNPWPQYSCIARLEALNSTTDEVVIVSAHQDSVNMFNPWFGRSPGADDDGSGTTTVFEALRALMKSDFVPKRPIEFHWYSAEEGGLLGSQKVVSEYIKRKVNVHAVYHSDMTGYRSGDIKPVIGVVTDYTFDELQDTVRMLIQEYSGSDHASWTKAGIPSAFAFEGPFEKSSPFIHTTSDTVENVNFEHMLSFSKIVVGFAIEISLY